MIWLISGVLLWSSAHLFKRIAPQVRARLIKPDPSPTRELGAIAITLTVYGVTAYIIYGLLGYPVHG